MEVISGLRRNQSHRRIQEFLTDINGEEVLSFGQAEGKLAGEILACVRRPVDPVVGGISASRSGDNLTLDE